MRGAPTSADWLLPRVANTVSAPAARAVASKFSARAPPEVAPITIACIRCAPAVFPRIQRAPVRPSAFVTPVSGTASPPPSVGVNTTLTPSTGLFSESVTRTREESGRGVATVAVWLLPATRVSAAGSPSLGSVKLSLLQVIAAAARTAGQAKGRILKDKWRCSVNGDVAPRTPEVGHSPCPDRGRYGIPKAQLPQPLAQILKGAGSPTIARSRHPLWKTSRLGAQGMPTDTPKFQSRSV